MSSSHFGVNSKITAASLLLALGIIYGDIGTSPLYVLKAVVGNNPVSAKLIYGGISCIFWTLTFQTTFKYIILTLMADNKGEGGIFSLYSLVRRYGKHLLLPTILGASALLADGIITPPVTVSSAIEGLRNLPALSNISTIPIVIVIISLMFFIQRFGTHKVGTSFGPAMFIWFSMLFVLGVNQVIHYPQIFAALNPYYAYDFLTTYPSVLLILGAVFLATTGAEALYSDLGHCGRKNIRLTWIFVKICLITNYMGQAAWLMSTQADKFLNNRNPFYEIMPNWFLIPGITIATLAAIIASQALISGSYTLVNEAMNLNFWPRVSVRQPSESKGQIYIPSVNLLLWLGCIMVVLYFKESIHMEAAYGLAITLTMISTTFLLGHYLYHIKKWNIALVIFITAVFLFIELGFLIANSEKFMEGGYITLLIAGVNGVVMLIMYYGRKISASFTKYTNLLDHKKEIVELSHDEEIPKFCTHLIYLTKSNVKNQIELKVINSIMAKKPKRADVYWFVHLRRTNEPYTLTYDVTELVDDKMITVNINIGFRLQPKTEYYFKQIVRELAKNKELNLHIRPDGSTKYNNEPDFKFVVIEKFLSVENEFSLKHGFLLNAYFLLKQIGLSDERAFGLEKSDVIVEQRPLVYKPLSNLHLKRVGASK